MSFFEKHGHEHNLKLHRIETSTLSLYFVEMNQEGNLTDFIEDVNTNAFKMSRTLRHSYVVQY